MLGEIKAMQNKTVAHVLWGIVPITALLWFPLRWGFATWSTPGTPLLFQVFVPLGAAYIAWSRREEWQRTQTELRELFPDPMSPKRVGNLSVVVLGGLVFLVSFLTAIPPLALFSLWLLLVGGIFYLYGPFLLRVVLAPLGFLLLGTPPPVGALSRLVNAFQGITAGVAGQALGLLGVKVRIVWGSITLLSTGYRLDISPSYTGLGVFFAMMVASLLLLFVKRVGVFRGAVYLLLAAVIACIANILRIVCLALIARSNPLLAPTLYQVPALPTLLIAFGLTYLLGNRLLRVRPREELTV